MPDETAPLDIAELRGWIGRCERATDVITPRLEASLRAVFDRDPGAPESGDAAMPTVHWCLAPAIAPMSGLGPDGHSARGGFLPPVPLPRRMWAGGALTFVGPLHVGDVVTRESVIEDVTLKAGRSGALCFVTVRHRVSTARGPAVDERQDLVYRDAPGVSAAAEAEPARPKPRWRRDIACDAVLLFRYSALTFNGHRIHYDRAYASGVEGYPDLVVHGPLQAAMLLDLAIEARGRLPRTFSFRSISPLLASGPFAVNAVPDGEGLRLWATDPAGRATMEASADWA